MKRVLITGATGFIGHHLVDTLLKLKKYKIRIFLRKQSNLTRLKKISKNKIEFFTGDFYKEEDIKNSLQNVDIFIHLASVLGRGRKEDYSKFNIKVSERFFYYASVKKKVKIIFISSFEVFGGSVKPYFYKETDKPAPLTSYGKSKHAVEMIAQEYIKKYRANITILRAPAVYGPEDNFDRGFIKMIDLIARNKFPPFLKMQNYMAVIYVENLVDIIIKCIHDRHSNNNLFLVADKEMLRTKDIFNLILILSRAKKPLIKMPVFAAKFVEFFFESLGKIFHFQPFYPENIVHNLTSNYACSLNKIENELGWIPPFSLYEGMKNTIQWYQKTRS